MKSSLTDGHTESWDLVVCALCWRNHCPSEIQRAYYRAGQGGTAIYLIQLNKKTGFMVFNLIKEVGLAILRRTISRGEPSSSHEYLQGGGYDGGFFAHAVNAHTCTLGSLRKGFAISLSLRLWGPRHDCACVKSTHPFKTLLTQGFCCLYTCVCFTDGNCVAWGVATGPHTSSQ